MSYDLKIIKGDLVLKNGQLQTKICKKCGIEKEISMFAKYRNRKGKLLHKATCRECYKPNTQKYYEKNNNAILEQKKEYYSSNKDVQLNKVKIYNETHKDEKKEYNKQYYEKNKDVMQAKHNIRRKNRRETDICYKLREDISTIIRRILKNSGSSKYGKSVAKYLSYSVQELKDYIESKFEPWMTWKNHGRYNAKTWNDNDQSTWTWQIDHIIPQSDLPYTSMEDDNFKKCWSLDNLRPYLAKQNHKDGVNRSRHRGKNVF